MTDRPHVIVIGAGIAGLAAAHGLLHGHGRTCSVTVVEADDRVGGKIRTTPFAGLPAGTYKDAVTGATVTAPLQLAPRTGLVLVAQ